MYITDTTRLNIAKEIERAKYLQEEKKSFRNNSGLSKASRQYGDILSEVMRKGEKKRGVIDVSPRELDRIIRKVTSHG